MTGEFTFTSDFKPGERLTKERLIDHQVRDAWIWFWLGWFRQ